MCNMNLEQLVVVYVCASAKHGTISAILTDCYTPAAATAALLCNATQS
jgi:hypothetical protein